MTENAESRALTFLGLCMRAGQLISGQDACVEAIRGGQAALALLDAAASENTAKRVKDACQSHETPLYQIGENRLGHAIGKPGRMVIVMPSGGMADKMRKLLNE